MQVTSAYNPAGPAAEFRVVAIVTRLAGPADIVANDAGQPRQEHIMDLWDLADLVHEAMTESQRNRRAEGRTLWWDAAEAASLIVHHIAEVTAGEPEVPHR
jgi:hypothetical protein